MSGNSQRRRLPTGKTQEILLCGKSMQRIINAAHVQRSLLSFNRMNWYPKVEAGKCFKIQK
jgi:hypothetical protein